MERVSCALSVRPEFVYEMTLWRSIAIRKDLDDFGPGAEVVEISQFIDEFVDAASMNVADHSRDFKQYASDQLSNR